MAGTGGLTRERNDPGPGALADSARIDLPTPGFGQGFAPAEPCAATLRPAPLIDAIWVSMPLLGKLAADLPAPAFGGAAPPLPFRAVNTPHRPGYDPGFQRHHLLPRQLLSARCFGAMMAEIGPDRIGFDDFRSNGLLLPATDDAAIRIGLPMHRGPHRDYNALVIERVGQIEESWSRQRLRRPDRAIDEAVMRIGVLQKALRRRLLEPARGVTRLNRFDPARGITDFAAIDSMVDDLWPATDPPIPAPGFGLTAQPEADDPSNLARAC